MTDTATHTLADSSIDWSASDCAPLDLATLAPDERKALSEQYFNLEKERVRALALHQRLAARGLGAQADLLRVKTLYGNMGDKAERLEAIETIVAQLESGTVPGLLEAIATGAGTSAALRLLAAVQCPDSPAGFGERLAVAVICRGDDDGAAFHLPVDVTDQTLEAIEIAAECLKNRLEIVETALERLTAAREGTGGPLQ
jgi:hypothetical protein